jgi:hypothetical protein
VVTQLIGQPGAFVRESALHARMLAAHAHSTDVTLGLLQESVDSLLRQMRADGDFLINRHPIGLNSKPPQPSRLPFGPRRS